VILIGKLLQSSIHAVVFIQHVCLWGSNQNEYLHKLICNYYTYISIITVESTRNFTSAMKIILKDKNINFEINISSLPSTSSKWVRGRQCYVKVFGLSKKCFSPTVANLC